MILFPYHLLLEGRITGSLRRLIKKAQMPFLFHCTLDKEKIPYTKLQWRPVLTMVEMELMLPKGNPDNQKTDIRFIPKVTLLSCSQVFSVPLWVDLYSKNLGLWLTHNQTQQRWFCNSVSLNLGNSQIVLNILLKNIFMRGHNKKAMFTLLKILMTFWCRIFVTELIHFFSRPRLN